MRTRTEPVAAAGPRLPVDRDAEFVQRDRVAADRPLADTKLGRSRAALDNELPLQ